MNHRSDRASKHIRISFLKYSAVIIHYEPHKLQSIKTHSNISYLKHSVVVCIATIYGASTGTLVEKLEVGYNHAFKKSCHKRNNLVVNHLYNFTRVSSRMWKNCDSVLVHYVNMLVKCMYRSYTPTCHHVLLYFLCHNIYGHV